VPLVRLQKILSEAGISSRRHAERLMLEGRVTVNGAVARQLGTRADPGRDDVRVDGRRAVPMKPRRYLLLNKPRGYVTTRSDPQGRPTVLDLLVGVSEYLYPVGRLDYDSEGLLLLTNDGPLAARLTHPRHAVEREYEATVQGIPSEAALRRLAHGVLIDGRRTGQALVRLAGRIGSGRAPCARLRIVVREGRNRQVRRMCDAIGHPVVRLRRVRIGPIADNSLKPGHARDLTPSEVRALKSGDLAI
jgi:pseudouridine synthase